MNTNRDNNPEEFLDLLVDDIRNEPVDAATVEGSSQRVWERIAKQAPRANRLSTCEDFQALIPAYRDGTLAPGRRMLLEDHTHQCVACRKVAFGEPEPVAAKVVEMPARRMTRSKWIGIAAAGAIALVFGRFGYDQFAPAPDGSRGTVETAQGSVYRVENAQLVPVSTGTKLDQNEVLRTAAGSNAVVKLMDGSVMEVGERAEFRLTASRRDVTVHLQRGAVIVQAAKRREGHLYVATGDSRVAVTGTVFSVNRGAKGTRVSVAEGEVVVEHRDQDKILHSGDQLATDRSMVAVPVNQEFAWSRNASEHIKLLQSMADIKKTLEQVRMPGVRYASPLLDHVPANAVLVLSVPNVRDSFEDAQRLVSQQLSRAGANSNQRAIEVIERMAKLTEYLGEEIVVALVPSGREPVVVAVADVHRPGLKEFLEKEWTKSGEAMHVIEGDAPVQVPAGQDVAVVIRGNRMAFSPNPSLIDAALTGNTGFSSTPFGQRVSQAVREGTGILLAVDLQTLIRGEATKKDTDQAILSRAGADGVRYLIAEQKTFNGNTQHSAVLNFDGPRHGMASWLAAPGPMGGLGFVSPRAQFAASVITKNPQQMIDEFFAFIEAQGPEGREAIERVQRQAGVDIRQDIAAALGSEATFAIDGPIIPVPSWKAVIEVNQPERLQQALVKMVAAANAEIQRTEKAEVTITLDTDNSTQGMVFYKITAGGGNSGQITTAYYTYSNGYMIAAPSKELIASAIQNRENGVRLDTSYEFRHLLPRDQNANFSALVYQNAKESLKLLSKAVPEDQEQARELMDKLEPTLIGAYASEDRIQVTTFGSSMDLLMQTAFAPMLHGEHNRTAPKKRGTSTTAAAYR